MHMFSEKIYERGGRGREGERERPRKGIGERERNVIIEREQKRDSTKCLLKFL